MEKDQYDQFDKMPDWELLGFAADHEHSQRRYAMIHILEQRRLKEASRSADKAAKAAKWSAIGAIASVVVATLTLIVSLLPKS